MSNLLRPVIYSGSVDAPLKDVKYDPAAIERLDSHFQSLVMNKKLQCASYLMSRGGKAFARKSVGKLTPHDDSTDLMPDSIRRIYSITKLFVAVAVMKLVEEGKLYLTQPMADFFEEFKTDLHKGINIYHLLTHTSGICPDPGYFSEPYARHWWDRIGAQQSPDYPENEKLNWIKAILAGPLCCKPGEKWNYSSAGYMLLGELISRAAGIHAEQYIAENILKPLAMMDTYFDVPEEKQGRTCYVFDWEYREMRDREDRNGKPPRTGGGMYSTLMDLFKFGQMLLNKGENNGVRILGKKTVEYMTKNHLQPNTEAFCWGADNRHFEHGLGFNLSITDIMTPGTYNHEGWGRSALYMDPDENFVFASFVPTSIEWVAESIISPRSIAWAGLL